MTVFYAPLMYLLTHSNLADDFCNAWVTETGRVKVKVEVKVKVSRLSHM